MKKLKIILLLLTILLLTYFYTTLNKNVSQEVLKIAPIKIEPIKIISIEEVSKEEAPANILSQLKVAIDNSQIAILPIKEEKNILEALSKQIRIQTPISTKMVKRKEIEATPITVKKQTITKQTILQKKSLIKKPLIKKPLAKQPVPQQKSSLFVKKMKPRQDIQKRVLPKEEVLILTKDSNNQLTREEEVALYNKKNTLDVVGISQEFEIKENTSFPDTHYFEPNKEPVIKTNNEPLHFVEKLGVVDVSSNYETKFVVPQKVELAKEGIVHFSTASIETKELKSLKFVDRLGVVEVSQEFEMINASKFIK